LTNLPGHQSSIETFSGKLRKILFNKAQVHELASIAGCLKAGLLMHSGFDRRCILFIYIRLSKQQERPLFHECSP
jgi:hypothetical protein